ncbi:hypothetical protein [Emticicia sp. BO119]|uniref:hypothetical protein n=1 Tax=Emticicia sp. BO119 TaxID=2757768 RepID=UPI0015F02E6D|nr:hypothetical protein [Emticicia sp. BO119]MBA4850487.1 hypothetical protein [Emticicia sp. BO119]
MNTNEYKLTKTNKYYFSRKALQAFSYWPRSFISQYFSKGSFSPNNISFAHQSADSTNAFHSIGRLAVRPGRYVGQANQTININKLKVFAIGVAFPTDTIVPAITVTPPATFVNGQKIYSFSDR